MAGTVTVATKDVVWFIGVRDWRYIATKMHRDPSGLERAMRRQAIDLSLADDLLTFLERPDAVSMLIRCVAHPCLTCGGALENGYCPECVPEMLLCAAGCGEHVATAGLCGWCVEEGAMIAIAA